MTIDIGNSRIKWATWRADKIVARGAAGYDKEKAGYALDELFSAVEKPVRVFAVCVAGDEPGLQLNHWVEQRWQLGVEYLKTEKQFNDVINAYDDPAQHGADRWAAIVAAHQIYPEYSACVICAGTAITFDLINKNGRHLGGYILPSYATMHAALIADTANVEAQCNMPFDDSSVPNNTNDAVNQGLHKLLQAGIGELCRFSCDKLSGQVKIVLTGGFAETILAYPDMPGMQHEQDLILQGLYSIMKQGKG